LPVSALLFGSQDNILFDDSIKNKFKVEFSTKLSRRTIFNFNKETPSAPNFATVEELIEYRETKEIKSIEASKKLNDFAEQLMINGDTNDITIDKSASDLFFI
jgi:hypothetical protein